MTKAIENADVVLAVVTDQPSSFVAAEMDHALAHRKTVMPIVLGEGSSQSRLGNSRPFA